MTQIQTTFDPPKEFSSPEEAAYFEEAHGLVIDAVNGSNLVEIVAQILSKGLRAERRNQMQETIYDGLYALIDNLEK